MPLSDEQWKVLARDLARAVARVAPEWSDGNAHDPGVTVLQLLAYALDDLAYRGDSLSADARALARQVARRAAKLGDAGATTSGDGSGGTGLVRPRYFEGRLLTADDLRLEQQYVLDRLSRRNRLLSGAGIVVGLDVTVERGSAGPQVEVAPGLALDPAGREIAVDRCQTLALPPSGSTLLVQLAYREELRDGVPAPGSTGDAAPLEATRIVETFAATLAAAPSAGSVDIARLRRTRGNWRVDPTFEAARVRR